jgi:hypothetical protein
VALGEEEGDLGAECGVAVGYSGNSWHGVLLEALYLLRHLPAQKCDRRLHLRGDRIQVE